MKKITLITGIMLTANLLSAQWIQQNPNYPTSGNFHDIQFINENQGFVVGECYYGTQNPHAGERTMDGGIIWEEITGVYPVGIKSIFLTDENKGWMAGDDMWFSDDTWYPDFGGLWEWQETGPFGGYYYSVFFIDSLSGWATGMGPMGGGGTFSKTIDGGINWIHIELDGSSQDVYFFNQSTGYAVGRLSWGPNGFGCILKTNDGGSNWIPDTIYDCSILNSICFIDQQKGWVVGGANMWPPEAGYIGHTSDGGSSWITQLTDTIPPLNAIQFIDELNGWAVGDSGTILHTSDGGNNWEFQESGTIADLNSVYFVDENHGWICGDSAIILYTDNGGTVVLIENLSNTSKLEVFPNPSNSRVTIIYKLEQKGNINLSILNSSGQEIKQISSGVNDKGKIDLDCSKFSSGIYFINLQTAKGILTEKLIIE